MSDEQLPNLSKLGVSELVARAPLKQLSDLNRGALNALNTILKAIDDSPQLSPEDKTTTKRKVWQVWLTIGGNGPQNPGDKSLLPLEMLEAVLVSLRDDPAESQSYASSVLPAALIAELPEYQAVVYDVCKYLATVLSVSKSFNSAVRNDSVMTALKMLLVSSGALRSVYENVPEKPSGVDWYTHMRTLCWMSTAGSLANRALDGWIDTEILWHKVVVMPQDRCEEDGGVTTTRAKRFGEEDGDGTLHQAQNQYASAYYLLHRKVLHADVEEFINIHRIAERRATAAIESGGKGYTSWPPRNMRNDDGFAWSRMQIERLEGSNVSEVVRALNAYQIYDAAKQSIEDAPEFLTLVDTFVERYTKSLESDHVSGTRCVP